MTVDHGAVCGEMYFTACTAAQRSGCKWEVTYDTIENKIIKEEIWLQFTFDEAEKWKKDHAK